jgi:hypothetical protein
LVDLGLEFFSIGNTFPSVAISEINRTYSLFPPFNTSLFTRIH